ncbi:hypothetical protein COCC4DRAFT_32923 [Bipolaris maydis ATCC 48331]|uniref:Uncharacterized protein n=2 Tax=Cochliobolus heterostrophus TaxID=5016 RepID=M2VAA1_COCH5|nr:uncharacterized protein COCC4DRAFT_32923 [Bipolaris maydis ATCC 48331]EMD96872.1 hypothetical protein COCHEDRAFT_1018609 [Bipolaris maydis C5]ENI03741.1 hypothetical protein COCC4DRAFT_32923 [Bipolaris maydis ATCC 48331]
MPTPSVQTAEKEHPAATAGLAIPTYDTTRVSYSTPPAMKSLTATQDTNYHS